MMRISALQIDGFGVWHDLRLENLSHGVTAFYGRNEAGKTTVMQFIRSMLYGLTDDRRQRYLHGVRGGKQGGWVDADGPAGAMRVSRYFELPDDNLGRVRVAVQDGREQGEQPLLTALADVDEATFNNVYAVGLRELQELATLSDSDSARWLYSLTTGLDRVSLFEVMRKLESSRDALLSRGGSEGTIRGLVERRLELAETIERLASQGRKWAQHHVRQSDLAAVIDQLEARRDEVEYHARTIEIATNIRSKWQTRANLDEQIQALSGRIRLPDDAGKQLDEVNGRIEEHLRQKEVLRRQRAGLKEEMESLGINETLVLNRARIEALGEQRDWLEALERQHVAIRGELAEIQTQLDVESKTLQQATPNARGQSGALELSERVLNGLRPLARAVRTARGKLNQCQQETEDRRLAAEEYSAQIAAAIPASARNGMPTDRDEAGQLVASLRKRLQVEQRLDQALRNQAEMEQQAHEWLDRQLMPLSLQTALWFGVGIGIFSVAIGLLNNTSPPVWFGGTLLIAAAVTWFVRYMSEDQASEKLEGCHRQLELIRRQIDEAKTEQEELAAQLGPIEGSVVVQLQAAERHLAELDKLLPVETQRKDAAVQAGAAERRLLEAENQFEKAQTNWRAKLVALGLPPEWTPAEIRAMAGRYEQVSELQLLAERRREDAQLRQREHATLTTRIRNLSEEVDMRIPDASSVEQLEHLMSGLRQQATRLEQRDKLLEKAKQLRSNENRHGRAADNLSAKRAATFARVGADDEAGYRQYLQEQVQLDGLIKERQSLSREITAAIGKHAGEEVFAELLAPTTIGLLEEKWEAASARLEEIESEIQAAAEERGALSQELKSLHEDRSLTTAQLELAKTEERLKRAVEAWRVRAATCQVLERIRAHYEQHRQPETLVEASGYLHHMTQGRYGRIWTPLGKDILFVDNADGESLPVEVLSRGTREQLFLCLRLALVGLYARRGVRLPLVLDDVLVNFDVERSERAVELMQQFAKDGHQLLVFTCHEHVWRMFDRKQLDARRLPDRFDAPARVERPAEAESEPRLDPLPAPKKRRRPRKRPRPSRKKRTRRVAAAAKPPRPVERTAPQPRPKIDTQPIFAYYEDPPPVVSEEDIDFSIGVLPPIEEVIRPHVAGGGRKDRSALGINRDYDRRERSERPVEYLPHETATQFTSDAGRPSTRDESDTAAARVPPPNATWDSVAAPLPGSADVPHRVPPPAFGTDLSPVPQEESMIPDDTDGTEQDLPEVEFEIASRGDTNDAGEPSQNGHANVSNEAPLEQSNDPLDPTLQEFDGEVDEDVEYEEDDAEYEEDEYEEDEYEEDDAEYEDEEEDEYEEEGEGEEGEDGEYEEEEEDEYEYEYEEDEYEEDELEEDDAEAGEEAGDDVEYEEEEDEYEEGEYEEDEYEEDEYEEDEEEDEPEEVEATAGEATDLAEEDDEYEDDEYEYEYEEEDEYEEGEVDDYEDDDENAAA